MNDYYKFVIAKSHLNNDYGFDATFIPDMLFDFQKSLVEWSLKKGRAAIFADCGLGKTFMQLVWAENVSRKTNGRVLILTPLTVSFQTVLEGEKIGVECVNRRDGLHDTDRIVVTNYERLHHFNSADFVGIVCDESSILKNFDGKTKIAVTEFARKIPYRLLCTATAAPNDYIELGTSSECLGEMGFSDMLSKFFKKVEKTQSRKDEHRFGVYRFRGYAELDFWRWVCSWSRALRKPSDLGFDDVAFALPNLSVRKHVVDSRTTSPDMLFSMTAVDLREQREELRRTIPERCEMVAELVNNEPSSTVSWCYLNDEGRMLRRLIPGSVEVSGSDSDERKESIFSDFAKGNIQRIVTKPKIGGFGLNWQHCHHHTFFPSHSYEQYYQCVRRSWRYGQTHPVTVDLIATEGQSLVLRNLRHKSEQADAMFDKLVKYMQDELNIGRRKKDTLQEVIPPWL
jgi:hypothetical protein